MKRYITLFLAAVSVLAPVSCEKQPDGSRYAVAEELSVSNNTVQLTSDGGSATVTVDTKSEIIASSEKSWVKIQVEGNKLTVSADANTKLETRYSNVVVAADGSSARIQVVQTGMNSTYVWMDSYTVPAAGAEIVLHYKGDGAMKMNVTGGDWLTVQINQEEKSLTLKVDKNPYIIEREGSLEWSMGDDNRTVSILQLADPNGKDPNAPELPVRLLSTAISALGIPLLAPSS